MDKEELWRPKQEYFLNLNIQTSIFNTHPQDFYNCRSTIQQFQTWTQRAASKGSQVFICVQGMLRHGKRQHVKIFNQSLWAILYGESPARLLASIAKHRKYGNRVILLDPWTR